MTEAAWFGSLKSELWFGQKCVSFCPNGNFEFHRGNRNGILRHSCGCID